MSNLGDASGGGLHHPDEVDEVDLLRPSKSYSIGSRSHFAYEELRTPQDEEDEWATKPDADGYELRSISGSQEPLNATYTPHESSINSGYAPLLPPDQSSQSGKGGSLFQDRELLTGDRVRRRNHRWFFSGWRGGVTAAACAAMAVLLLNTILTIWASVTFPMDGGIGTLIKGDCSKSKSWAQWIHLAINALSTILLGASNYTMQTLIAPSRREVDEAHAKGKMLAIGVPSVQNLGLINRKRLWLFIVLTISSVPLHLMYNSTVFETLTARTYSVFVVSESFLNGAQHNEALQPYIWEGSPHSGDYFNGWAKGRGSIGQSPLTELQGNISSLTQLSPSDCISAYGSELVTDRGSLLAVTSSTLVNTSLSYSVGARCNESVQGWYQMQLSFGNPSVDWSDPLAWICAYQPGYNAVTQTCNSASALASASNWTIFNQTITYCLSQPKEGTCTLQFSLALMIVIIIMNAVKAACMALTVWRFADECPLVTVGDAAASFLEKPDPTTEGLCLFARIDFQAGNWTKVPTDPSTRLIAKPFVYKRAFWLNAPNVSRWVITFLLCATALGICGGLLGLGLSQQASTGGTSLTDLWNLGFGNINVRSLIAWSIKDGGGDTFTQPLLAMILLANTPQVILSTLYFMYNALFTSMLSEHEWQQFMTQRKALRVTVPKVQQRSTYFLSLPYRYALPLMLVSALLHWLVSQSIFLAKVTVLDESETPIPADALTTCGWSSIAIILTIIVGALILIAAFAMGFWRFKGSMPIAGGCSAVISAACHPDVLDKDTSLLPLQWGALGGGEPGHCTLTGQPVNMPVPGELYA